MWYQAWGGEKSQDLGLSPAFVANKLCKPPRSLTSLDLNALIYEGRTLADYPQVGKGGLTLGDRAASDDSEDFQSKAGGSGSNTLGQTSVKCGQQESLCFVYRAKLHLLPSESTGLMLPELWVFQEKMKIWILKM